MHVKEKARRVPPGASYGISECLILKLRKCEEHENAVTSHDRARSGSLSFAPLNKTVVGSDLHNITM